MAMGSLHFEGVLVCSRIKSFCGGRGAINKPPTRRNIMADEDEEQATALAAPLLEDASEAPVNEAPEQNAAGGAGADARRARGGAAPPFWAWES